MSAVLVFHHSECAGMRDTFGSLSESHMTDMNPSEIQGLNDIKNIHAFLNTTLRTQVFLFVHQVWTSWFVFNLLLNYMFPKIHILSLNCEKQ